MQSNFCMQQYIARPLLPRYTLELKLLIARKPYKSKAAHTLYLRDSACVQIQSLRLGTVSDHRALYITLMFDTVPVAMHGNLLQSVPTASQRNKHQHTNRENLVDTSTQQREAISQHTARGHMAGRSQHTAERSYKLAHSKRAAHGREASTRQESGTSTRQTYR